MDGTSGGSSNNVSGVSGGKPPTAADFPTFKDTGKTDSYAKVAPTGDEGCQDLIRNAQKIGGSITSAFSSTPTKAPTFASMGETQSMFVPQKRESNSLELLEKMKKMGYI